MKIKRIVFSGTFSFPYGDAPGERIKNLAKGFTEYLNAISVVSLYGMPIDGNFKSGKIQVDSKQIQYRTILDSTKQKFTSNRFLRMYYRIKYLIALPSLIKETLDNLTGDENEILFLYGRSYLFLNGILQGIKKRKFKTKTIFDVVEPPRLQGGMLEFIKHPFILDSYIAFKCLIAKFDLITFISFGLKNQYEHQVKQYIILPSLSFKANSDSKQVEYRNHKILRIAYLGSLFEKDYPELMFELCQKLYTANVPFEFNLIGRYRQVYVGRKWLNNFENSDFKKCLKFVESPSDEEKVKALRESDFICLFRKPEKLQELTFPTRVTEILSLNKVLFLNTFGDFQFYFEDQKNAVVINDANDSTLIDRIQSAMSEGNYNKILQGGKVLMNEEFDATYNAKKIINKLTK